MTGGSTSTTQPITYTTNSSSLQTSIQNALAALSNIGTANVAVGPATDVGGGFTGFPVRFQGSLGSSPQPVMTFIAQSSGTTGGIMENAVVGADSDASLTVTFVGTMGGTALPTMSSNSSSVAVATTTAGGPGDVTGGTLYLSTTIGPGFLTNTGTGAVSYSATPETGSPYQNGSLRANIQLGLDGLDAGAYAGATEVADVSATSATITDQGSIGGIAQTNFAVTPNNRDVVEAITFGGNPVGTSFTLSYAGQTTGNIAYTTSSTLQSTIQSALNSLSALGGTVCTVTASSATAFSVQFADPDVYALPLIQPTLTARELSPATASVTVATIGDSSELTGPAVNEYVATTALGGGGSILVGSEAQFTVTA